MLLLPQSLCAAFKIYRVRTRLSRVRTLFFCSSAHANCSHRFTIETSSWLPACLLYSMKPPRSLLGKAAKRFALSIVNPFLWRDECFFLSLRSILAHLFLHWRFPSLFGDWQKMREPLSARLIFWNINSREKNSPIYSWRQGNLFKRRMNDVLKIHMISALPKYLLRTSNLLVWSRGSP